MLQSRSVFHIMYVHHIFSCLLYPLYLSRKVKIKRWWEYMLCYISLCLSCWKILHGTHWNDFTFTYFSWVYWYLVTIVNSYWPIRVGWRCIILRQSMINLRVKSLVHKCNETIYRQCFVFYCLTQNNGNTFHSCTNIVRTTVVTHAQMFLRCDVFIKIFAEYEWTRLISLGAVH